MILYHFNLLYASSRVRHLGYFILGEAVLWKNFPFGFALRRYWLPNQSQNRLMSGEVDANSNLLVSENSSVMELKKPSSEPVSSVVNSSSPELKP